MIASTSHTSAPESVATVASFRTWRGSQHIVAKGPILAMMGSYTEREGFTARHPWRLPFGRPSVVQNGNPAILSNLRGFSSILSRKTKLKTLRVFNFVFTEREGFEPSVRYERTHAFQACSLNHSDISPKQRVRLN